MFYYSILKQLFFPKLKFGIFGFSLGGGGERSNFSESSEQDITRAETETERQTGGTTTRATGEETSLATDITDQTVTGEQTLQLLDEETQALLQGLITDLSATGTSSALIGDLQDRALAAPERVEGLIDPIVANARTNLENQLGASLQGLARSAGSSQNSLVQQLGLGEAANVEREIADLAATLGFQAEGVVSQLQTGAVQTQASAVTQLADVLKGATQAGTTTETTEAVRQLEELLQTDQTERQIIDLTTVSDLESLITAIERSSGEGSTVGASAGFSLGF